MNVKLDFVVKLPQGVIDAMHLNEETSLCSWIEAGELHVRVEDDPRNTATRSTTALTKASTKGTTQDRKKASSTVMPPDMMKG
nr:hypothetical protein [Clostridia bacterium]